MKMTRTATRPSQTRATSTRTRKTTAEKLEAKTKRSKGKNNGRRNGTTRRRRPTAPEEQVFPDNLILRGVSEETWNTFREVATRRHIMVNKLMVAVLNEMRSAIDIESVLDVDKTGALEQLTRAIEKLAWAEHAFAHGFWNWSLARLIDVLRQAQDEPGLVGLAQSARHKIGFVLMEIAARLEQQGLYDAFQESDEARRTSMAKFAAAKEALYRALAINNEFLEIEREEIVVFNQACAMSVLARIHLHESANIRRLDAIRELASVAMAGDFPNRCQSAWKKIGASWRAEDPESVKTVEELGSTAIDWLHELTNTESTAEAPPPSFWLDLAEGDPDLVFLREDNGGFSRDFDRWKKHCLKKAVREGGVVNQDLASLMSIAERLPDLVSAAQAIRREFGLENGQACGRSAMQGS